MPSKGTRTYCVDCKGTHARYVRLGHEMVWLCVDCEYDRRYPEQARPMVPVPWEREPAPLQSERLF
jgi:RNase P subunit RPR2